MKNTRVSVVIGMGSMLCLMGLAGPDTTSSSSLNNAAIQTASVVELGAVAADLVGQAPATERQAVTRGVVAAAIERQPAATLLVVGAVAQKHPTMAPVAAGTAAKLLPKQSLAIVRTAIQRAPSQVTGIVREVSKVVSKQYKSIAMVAIAAAPRTDAKVLAGLAEGVPALEPMIERVQSDVTSVGLKPTVPQTLAVVDDWATKAGKGLKVNATQLIASNDPRLASFAPPPGPPTVGPYYHPAPTSPTQLTPADSATITSRTYSAP